MKFAVLLGLVENNGNNEYRLLPCIANSRSALMEAQKSTLSALYEFFGDDIFSVEMAVAKLEYSTSHLSGMLHQFTWISDFLKAEGITEFTISSTFSSLIQTLAGFEKHGYRMNGLTEVNANYTDFTTGKKKIVPAIRMKLN